MLLAKSGIHYSIEKLLTGFLRRALGAILFVSNEKAWSTFTFHLATLTKILGRGCGIYTLPTRTTRRRGQVDSLKMIIGPPEDEL